jgi:pseudaminic acid biosynthesis-associated methylase
MNFKTEQEDFWAGDFGTEYMKRNQGGALLASNLNFLVKALQNTREIRSCIEFGANLGMNLKALKLLYPAMGLHAIEINLDAVRELRQVIPSDHVYHSSILEWISPSHMWDLVLIKGVLIHINPDELHIIYDKLVASARRYLLVAEYYNPEPVAIPYRGHANRLFKRDFAGEIMNRHPEIQLLDYGFIYRRDPKFPQDDMTWFLLEKINNIDVSKD